MHLMDHLIAHGAWHIMHRLLAHGMTDTATVIWNREYAMFKWTKNQQYIGYEKLVHKVLWLLIKHVK